MQYGKIDSRVYKWLQWKGYTTDKSETTKRLLLEIVVDEDEIDIHSAKWYPEYYEADIKQSSGWRADYDNDPDVVETVEIDCLSPDFYELIENWYDYNQSVDRK